MKISIKKRKSRTRKGCLIESRWESLILTATSREKMTLSCSKQPDSSRSRISLSRCIIRLRQPILLNDQHIRREQHIRISSSRKMTSSTRYSSKESSRQIHKRKAFKQQQASLKCPFARRPRVTSSSSSRKGAGICRNSCWRSSNTPSLWLAARFPGRWRKCSRCLRRVD